MRPSSKVKKAKKNSAAQKQCTRFSLKGSCRFGEGCKYLHDVESSKTSLGDAQKSTEESTTGTTTHLDKFFAEFPEFPYNPSAPVMAEFSRMCTVLLWNRQDREEPRQLLHDAITQQFNAMYGTNVDDINAWRNLCQVVGIHPIPEELEECRRKVATTHVNLVDLVDMAKTGDSVTVFDSVEELSRYTLDNRKCFPKKNAYAGGLLKFLLRQILHPDRERKRRASGKASLAETETDPQQFNLLDF